jgi:hypothetical protein
MLCNIQIKWPDRNKPKKKKLEVRQLGRLDWQTRLWFEHEIIPVPFVSDRETIYVERCTHRARLYSVSALSSLALTHVTHACCGVRACGPNALAVGEGCYQIVRYSLDDEDAVAAQPVGSGRVRGVQCM